MKLWGVFAFALIGATATTFAVTRLQRAVDWVYSQQKLNRSRESARSFRTAFQEDAWKRYNKWMQEAYEEEMERVELSSENQEFTPSDVERALWSSAVDAKLKRSPTDVVPKSNTSQTSSKKKRKR